MRLSSMFMPTQREVPAEAEIASHKLMLRAGLMRKIASGVYSYLPLGYRTFRKIEAIIREEMDNAGAQEIIMPAILPAEIYKESGRWDVFGPEMFRLKDRNGREFCLGPTHEEPFTETVRNEIRSYRALPVTLYQIQHKYRDEKRPRFGVMRSREFVMKDAYSFDRDDKGLDTSYNKMAKAYCAVFDRCGLDYITVEADSGAMGGSGSQEFMVKSDVGEANIAFCDNCGYAANDERAECVFRENEKSSALPAEKVYTPDSRTIEELMDHLGLGPSSFAKSLIYLADGEPVMAMVRGDRELNETKLSNLLKCNELTMAGSADVEEITGAEVGFAGPVGLKKRIKIICDKEVAGSSALVVGANETSYHLKNISPARDFIPDIIADVRIIVKGDACPSCGTPVEICKGIEVGHIFKLGTKYSKALGCNFLDEEGNEYPMVMGCYGIGLNRTMAAVIEQNHDENGIIWPVALAPYHVTVIPVMVSDEVQMKLAEDIYAKLKAAGVEALLDDRDERPGVKFKDNELTGIPLRITVGRKAGEGIAELKKRAGSEMRELSSDEAVNAVIDIVRGNINK